MVPGKCPKCEKPVTVLRGHGLTVEFGPDITPLKAVSYQCPSCQTVLGCQIDPIAVRTEAVAQTVDELLEKLRQP